MNQETVYKAIYAAIIIFYTLIRIPHARRNKSNVTIKTNGERRERILVFIASIGMMGVPITWMVSDVFHWAVIDLPSYARIAGIAASILSLWLFYEVHRTLGRNWSPVLQIRKDHTLTKDGPYKRIRHPMYTQIWIMIIAQLFITSNWFVGLAGLASWSILYFIRVPKEEKMMEDVFGEAYLSYKAQTGRILPKL